EPDGRRAELHRQRHGRDRFAHHGDGHAVHPLPPQVEIGGMQAIQILFEASLWAAAVRIASPLIFATLGELICERAGVLNLGIEGIMTVGAFAGWFTVYLGGDLWSGIVVAALVGALFGLLHALLVVPLGLSQHVTGI